MSIVLDVSNVSKCYATYSSNLQRFANWFGAAIKPAAEFWASRSISFRLQKGEAVALIGQNGAGKSTLLKMVTGTVRPTKGTIAVNGRISAILELGLGFNPEFTGRQNIYQAGGLMGYSQLELTEMMPAIEEFAEIGEFFDQSIRVYSSGMQARLAFALATAKRPDLLIVDEVLSVGDSYFQHKSFDRIRQFKAEGTSILLVTHSLGDVRALCDRVILIDKGAVIKDGNPDEVVDYYNALIAERENVKFSVEQKRNDRGWLYTRSGNFEAYADAIELLDGDTLRPVTAARVGQDLVMRVKVIVTKAMPKLVLGLMLRDRTGHIIWGSNTWHTRQVVENVKAGEVIQYSMPFKCDLGPNSFSFSTSLSGSDTHLDENYEWQDNVVVFDVVNAGLPVFIGTTYLNVGFEIER